MQTSSTDFDFSQPLLNSADFESETCRSKVYDALTKQSLVQLSIALCELAVSLTDMIMLVYPLHESIDSSLSTERIANQSLDRLLPFWSALTGWFKRSR
jgi:hypothetical protein